LQFGRPHFTGDPNMPSDGSVSRWLGPLRAGDPAAAQKLWECYFQRLVGLARARLQGRPRRAADEEDVALSAFDSFCRAAQGDRFPQLTDRDNLWRLLVVITARKATRLARDERRLKRGGGAVMGESGLPAPDTDTPAGLDRLAGDGPTPEFAALVAEEYERLLAALGTEELRAIAVWKMEGETNRQIADRLGCAPPTVERRLALIRRVWGGEGRP
jgi:DNA-directed RNA polymerase specialized sigma24 family protein